MAQKFDPNIYLGNPNLPSTKAEFEYTPAMLKEIDKCTKNIAHFAENHFFITTMDHGKQKIKLFKPQKRVLKCLDVFNRVVTLSSRQSGKCVTGDTIIRVRNNHNKHVEDITIKKFHENLKLETPVTFIEKCISMMCKIINGNIPKKFVETVSGSKYSVFADTGWNAITTSNKTVDYAVWEIKTKEFTLTCADTHFVFDNKLTKTFVSDLRIGTKIHTKNGIQPITSIKKLTKYEPMYDLQLGDRTNHRYYTNGILSHNTTLMTIFSLWMTMFASDKTVLIVANKEATAIEILRRIRMAYELMPNWLKPGVKEWGKTSIVFSNDSRIIISSTSSSSSRGQTANCVTGDSIVTLKDKRTSEIFDISMKDLADILERDGHILAINLLDNEDE